MSKSGEWLLSEGPNVVGRDGDCAIRIDSSTLSRRHARIVVTGREAVVEDLGSKNGTMVNRAARRRASRAQGQQPNRCRLAHDGLPDHGFRPIDHHAAGHIGERSSVSSSRCRWRAAAIQPRHRPRRPLRQLRAPAAWSLVFADEFDAAGPVDSAKWGYELGYIRNNERQFYTSRAENVRAEGGNLVIEGRKESYQGSGYTSASINTRGRFEFLYGRVEVRAKLPTGKGSWPAIWMLGTNIGQAGWPTCGEIDIMENVLSNPLRIHSSVHTAAYNHTVGTPKSASVVIANPADDLHGYRNGVVRRPHRRLRRRAEILYVHERRQRRARVAVRQTQYLLINLAIGGAWGGQQGIDDSRFPHRYLVDYVRIYQQK